MLDPESTRARKIRCYKYTIIWLETGILTREICLPVSRKLAADIADRRPRLQARLGRLLRQTAAK